MNKKFTCDDILNAKDTYLYDNEILYIVDADDNAYGYRRQSKEWFEKKNFWDYFDSKLMLQYFNVLSKDEAVQLYLRWSSCVLRP